MEQDPDFPAFKAFVEKYQRQYATEVETLGRFQTFKHTLQLIKERNAKGQEKHGITKFADLTLDEFKQRHTGLRPTDLHLAKKRMLQKDHGVSSDYKTASIDWRSKGAVTPIKNQGQCGSCWAFSATEQLESDYFLTYGELRELSPQQATSCTTTCYGCQGGNPINAWDYINGYGGQDSKSSYPYVSGITGSTGSCTAKRASREEDVGNAIGYYVAQEPSQESNMLKQIESSPMSICVDATLWQTYESGVITTASNCGTSIDHAVQVVGYNSDGNYWIVRNSWGTSWAPTQGGYVYVEAGANVCGITHQATITVPSKVAAETLVV